MNEKAKQGYWTFRNLRKQVWVWLLLIPLGLVIYHQDAIRGQWKFERLCKEDGGARFYGMIEKGKGWTVDGRDQWSYQGPFVFGDIDFVRYTNQQGEEFDVTKKKGVWPPEYVFSPVDQNRAVRYRYSDTTMKFHDDNRFSKHSQMVSDYQTGAILADYKGTSHNRRWR